MASNDTAALVVALSAQISKFEKDMQSAVSIADKHTKEIETRFGAMNTAITSKLTDLGNTAAGNLGFAGTLLRTLGPLGVAAAVGIGAAVGGILALADATAAFADKAKALKEASDITGLTITQFKLLGEVGKTVGQDFDQTSSFFEHFLANVEQLRKGGGPLYDALLKINTGLLRQLSASKDSASAIDILVNAYNRLENAGEKLALSKAAGGKTGLSAGNILETLGQRGGLPGLEASSPGIDEAQIKRARDLSVEITAIRDKAYNIWGSMFSDQTLRIQKEEAEQLLTIAQYVERIKNGSGSELTYASHNQQLFNNRFQPAVDAPLKQASDSSFSDRFAPALQSPLKDFTKPQSTSSGNSAVELAILQKNITLLGEAVTQADQLKLKRLELAAAAEKGGVADGVATRALQAFKDSQLIAANAMRERLAIATQDQITEARLVQLSQDRTKYGLTENEVQKATVVILREAKDAADALTVRQAYLPGLKQLELDSGNLRKSFDQFSASSFNSLTDGLASIVTGSVAAKDAFKTMTDAILSDLAKLVIRQSITGPLAGALGGLLGGGGGGVTDVNNGFVPSINGGGIIPGHASGTNYAPGGLSVVGENGPELINLSRGSQVIPNDVLRNGGGGGSPVTINVIEDSSRAGQRSQSSNSQGGTNIDIYVDQIVAKNMATPGSASNTTLRAAGVQQQLVRR